VDLLEGQRAMAAHGNSLFYPPVTSVEVTTSRRLVCDSPAYNATLQGPYFRTPG
jgi:hypothetical protein